MVIISHFVNLRIMFTPDILKNIFPFISFFELKNYIHARHFLLPLDDGCLKKQLQCFSNIFLIYDRIYKLPQRI